jgi:transposase InsO family protein
LRIKRVDARKAMMRREGTAAARAAFTPVVGEYRCAGPLDVVQIDHTIVDLIVVDEVTRTPIGRPVLTLAIDIHTRVVTGFYLGLDHPSILRAGVCVAQSVFEKGTWLAERGIDLPWPVSGLPRAVHVDNAGEFHSSAFTRTLEDFGVEVIYRPIARPHFGGHIERLIGTAMGAVHVLRGTTFSSVKDRAGYSAEGRASPARLRKRSSSWRIAFRSGPAGGACRSSRAEVLPKSGFAPGSSPSRHGAGAAAGISRLFVHGPAVLSAISSRTASPMNYMPWSATGLPTLSKSGARSAQSHAL